MLRGRSPQRFLATILFTDIVGSTDLAAQLGDRKWRSLVAAHHAAVRRELRRYGGREVDTAGDGFLVTFGQPAQAVRAADAIAREIAKLGVTIRAGIHTGETEAIGQKIGGIAVHIASRIMALAGPNEVLVSATVRDLVTGSDLEFTDRGRHQLRGVPGEWLVWSLVRQPVPEPGLVGTVVAVPEPETPATRGRQVAAVGVAVVAVLLVGILVGSQLIPRPAVPRPSASGSAFPAFSPGPNTAIAIDVGSGAVVDGRTVSGEPSAIAADESSIWVGAIQGGLAVRLDPGSPTVAQPVGRVGRPTALALGNGIAWVADGFANQLTLLDATTGLQRDAHEDVHVRALAFGFGALWATDDIADELRRFDGRRGDPAGTVELEADSYPIGLAASSDAIWVAGSRSATLARVDPGTMKVTTAGISLRGAPDAVAAGSADVWITSSGSDLLARLDPATNAVTSTTSICDAPVAAAADGTTAWVACAQSREVWHVGRDGSVLAKVRVGGRPTGIALSGGRLWVALASP